MKNRVSISAALLAVLSACAHTPEELASSEPRVFASSADAGGAARCVADAAENWGTQLSATIRQRADPSSQEVLVRSRGREATNLLVARVDARGGRSQVSLHVRKSFVLHEQMASAIADRCRTRT